MARREDILEHKEEILQWIEEHQSKAFICKQLHCKQETLNSYLKKMGIVYEGNKSGKGFPDASYKTAEEYAKKDCVKSHILKIKLIRDGIKEKKCEICGAFIWQGKELTLILDHINDSNHDDRLENLRWVCPNCDRQLDTFCAKNANRETFYNYKPKEEFYCADCGKPISQGAIRCVVCQGKAARKVERPSAEELKQILIDNKGNFAAVGRMFGINDNSIRKWCVKYGMSTHSGDYK